MSRGLTGAGGRETKTAGKPSTGSRMPTPDFRAGVASNIQNTFYKARNKDKKHICG